MTSRILVSGKVKDVEVDRRKRKRRGGICHNDKSDPRKEDGRVFFFARRLQRISRILTVLN